MATKKKVRKTASEKAVEDAKVNENQKAGLGKLREIQAKDQGIDPRKKEVFQEVQKAATLERFNGEVKLVITKKNSETTGKVEVHIRGIMKGIEDDVEFIIKGPIELAKRYLPEQDIQIESWNPQTKL